MERIGQAKDLENANEAELMSICKEYFERLKQLEGQKYDLEYETAKKDFEVSTTCDPHLSAGNSCLINLPLHTEKRTLSQG